MPGKPLRIGIIGAGRNARRKHLPAFQSMQGVEVVAVANRGLTSAREVAAEYSIPRVFSRWEDLLGSGVAHAVLVGTWPESHAAISIAALESGCHVLCEGRMAADLASARAMADAAAARPELVLQIAPTAWGLDIEHLVRRLVEEELGELVAVEGRFHEGGFGDPDRPVHWRELQRHSGRNIMSLGRRYEALLRWLPPVDIVAAQAHTAVRQRPDGAGGADRVAVDVPDTLGVLGSFSSGAVMNVLMTTSVGAAPRGEFHLHGGRASIRVQDGGRVRLVRSGDGTARSLEPAAAEIGRWEVEREFVNSILTGTPVRKVDVQTGLRYMAFTDAVWRSIRSGASERVDVTGQAAASPFGSYAPGHAKAVECGGDSAVDGDL